MNLGIIYFIQALGNPVYDFFAIVFSFFFSFWFFFFTMAAIYLVKNLRALFMLITASVATGAVVEILKLLIERVRPGLDIFPKYISMSYGSSFPSGHTALAFLTAVILSKYYPKYAKTFYTVAFFVGYFRLYMGVHYLTDVIGGALVGCIMGLTFLLYEKDVMSFEAKILKRLKSKFKR